MPAFLPDYCPIFEPDGRERENINSCDDIAHYQRFVVALRETIRLMEKIDQAIKGHGGAGKVNLKTLPRPISVSTATCPPSFSTMRRTMDSSTHALWC